MIKIILSIVLILIGIYTLGFIGVGSHGHFMFRPWMLEDWIFWGIVVICFGVPILLLLRRKK